MILSGSYLGHLPDHYARQWVADGRLRAIAGEGLTLLSTFYMVTPKARRQPRLAEAFIEVVRATLKRAPAI